MKKKWIVEIIQIKHLKELMKRFIICPNCGVIELAEVIETFPFYSYVHYCSKCDYCIMESEWEQAKAISIKQPWAYLICSGIKDIENRTWKTNFRGRVLIHSGAKSLLPEGDWSKIHSPLHPLNKDQRNEVLKLNKVLDFINNGNIKSAIIGSVEIDNVVINHKSIWAEKTAWYDYHHPVYNWVLANPVLFEKPVLNVKGKLSFFIPEIL